MHKNFVFKSIPYAELSTNLTDIALHAIKALPFRNLPDFVKSVTSLLTLIPSVGNLTLKIIASNVVPDTI